MLPQRGPPRSAPWWSLPVKHCLPHLLLAATAFGGLGHAQVVRALVPLGTSGPAPAATPPAERGVPPQLFENPNLDRYLRRAQTFLDAANYANAIEVLQDVILGRTVEFLTVGEPGPSAAGEGGGDGVADSAAGDAANSVFSLDQRLFRPVRRLCHEMLARMPPQGIELYRTMFEVAAAEQYEAALASGSTAALEQIINRYFVTMPAGKAMVLLADRLLHEGRYRAAVQILRDLLEVYPAANRGGAGVDPVWCKFKIALCLRMAGEPALALDAVRRLAAEHPDDSLRILGELQAVRDLPTLQVFAADLVALPAPAAAAGPSWLDDATEQLVPLWHYRFVDPDPYRRPKSSGSDNVHRVGGPRSSVMPHANRYGPASWLRFVPGAMAEQPAEVLFLDHYRLRVADACTGLLLRATDGKDAQSNDPKDNYPRIRIAASDFALLRPVEDEVRRYVVKGCERSQHQHDSVLLASELVAYGRDTLARVWSSADMLDGPDGLREVTFLAAPTVFGERLLLPALRRGAYSLECIDRVSGQPLWHTLLHAEGSEFKKAPGTPVAVAGGTAFVLTNAGCLAAADAFSGDLRWIRRYERDDPLRPRLGAAVQAQQIEYSGQQFAQEKIAGFFPNDLVVAEGLVIGAPCDGGVLFGIDGATGEIVWLLDGQTGVAPYGELTAIVGTHGTDLFATSTKALVCLDLRGGLVKWFRALPPSELSPQIGRGRGVIAGDAVVLPGDGELLVFPAGDARAMRRIPLPRFGVGREPLPGPFNVVAAGPWLGLGYQGGVEVFSSAKALLALAAAAAGPRAKARLYGAAGEPLLAEQVLREWLATPGLADGDRGDGAQRLLALVRERALAQARQDGAAGALALLDGIAAECAQRSVRQTWHLARLEVCKEVADLRAHEVEQQRLYDFMEGRQR
jgi:outer membrane protein assembly factor BamB/tetratricopeptide (TPR) repeat protein